MIFFFTPRALYNELTKVIGLFFVDKAESTFLDVEMDEYEYVKAISV